MAVLGDLIDNGFETNRMEIPFNQPPKLAAARVAQFEMQSLD